MSPFERYKQALDDVQPVGVSGRVSAVRGLTVSVADFPVPMAAACRIEHGKRGVEARVIGFAGERTLVMPIGSLAGICRGDRVVCTSTRQTVGVGPEMLGRVVDAFGGAIDGRGDLRVADRAPIWPEPIAPMRRVRISEPLSTGVRAIDALLTVGRGQRMGIFSGSGVGKSVLLGMISRYTSADVTVIGLIGERGREVLDFIEQNLGPEGLKRSVVVVSTGDSPPLLRVQAGAVATAVAEYFRDAGMNVLLVMDSLSRLATAQRQIGLVAGEPPAARGYTPSVFNLLPELLERCGRTRKGSITGFYSVLVEGDEPAEPIGEAVRAVTDGHITLSRDLANRGQYPAVDVLASISRIMPEVVSPSHRRDAGQVRRVLALYSEIEELVNIGAYQPGASGEYDLAIKVLPDIRRFLAQPIDERADFAGTLQHLGELCGRIERQSQPRAVLRPVRPGGVVVR
jgi:flagellum-specific ATP synthase